MELYSASSRLLLGSTPTLAQLKRAVLIPCKIGYLHQDFPWDHLDQRRLTVPGAKEAVRMPGAHLNVLFHSGK